MNKPDGPLELELMKATRLNDRFGPSCLDYKDVRDLLLKYQALISKTDDIMRARGIVAACTRCAVSGKGSCCFKGMDEGYGFLLLYINLLLGSTFSDQAEFPEICHFIGKNGCELQARHSFCLNYFCPDLKHSLGEKIVTEIQVAVGEQLFAGWELERTLTRWLADADRMAFQQVASGRVKVGPERKLRGRRI
jgi:hypothetical protein